MATRHDRTDPGSRRRGRVDVTEMELSAARRCARDASEEVYFERRGARTYLVAPEE